MIVYVLNLRKIDQTLLPIVGSKCVNLGELLRLEGVIVPDGFCVTAEAYLEAVSSEVRFNELIVQLSPGHYC